MKCLNCGEVKLKEHACSRKNIKVMRVTVGLVLLDVNNYEDEVRGKINIFVGGLYEIPGVRDVQIISPLQEI